MCAQAVRDDRVEVTIEPMLRRHVRKVIKIEEASFPRPWSLSLFLSELSMPATRGYFVAKLDDAIVGYGGLMMTGDDCHITTIAVAPEHLRRGIGTQILIALVDEALSRSATGITLEVRTGNLAAQNMYKRFGFRPVGIRKNYYIETGEDALIMWARNVNSAEFAAQIESIRRSVGGGRPRRWREARQ